jgi:hypothetical protein
MMNYTIINGDCMKVLPRLRKDFWRHVEEYIKVVLITF